MSATADAQYGNRRMYVNPQNGVDEFFFAAMLDSMEIGTILAEARKAAGLAQKDVAGMLGISAQYLCDMELNRRPLPLSRVGALPPPIRAKVARALVVERWAETEQLHVWAREGEAE